MAALGLSSGLLSSSSWFKSLVIDLLTRNNYSRISSIKRGLDIIKVIRDAVSIAAYNTPEISANQVVRPYSIRECWIPIVSNLTKNEKKGSPGFSNPIDLSSKGPIL